ncbi:MAG: NifU family protein [Ruminococcaceae bacterium]|nr:NifU family protein [Oscillospiraceae bacterium]
MRETIERVLNETVRPQLAKHHGDVELLEVEQNVVHIRLLGQCAHCPSAYLTTEEVILSAIREVLPQIQSVAVRQEVSESVLAQAKEIWRARRGE